MFRAPERTLGRGILVTTAALTLSQAFGEGFRNPPPGSFSLARAGGRRAHIDTPDAAYHNPANVVDIPGITAEISPTFVYLKVKHDNALSGQSAETTDPFKILPNAFATFPIIEGKLSAGLAVTSPFGLSNEWDEEGAFAPGGIYRNVTAWYTELMTVDVGPSISWRVNEHIALGFGLDVYWSQLTLKQFYPAIPAFGLPENKVKAKGDGTAVGGNFGITVDLSEKQRAAFTYRSPFEVDYEGDVRFDDPTPTGLRESDFRSEIEFPMILGFGYGVEVSDTVRLEVGLEWLQFSNFDKLPIDPGANSPLFPPNYTINQDWDDTFTAGIAGDWRFHDNWTARGGYQYYESPVPNHTFSPTIPDANQHAITAGISFASGAHRGDFSYGYIIYDDRDIDNSGPASVFNGHYEMNVHLFSLGYTYHF